MPTWREICMVLLKHWNLVQIQFIAEFLSLPSQIHFASSQTKQNKFFGPDPNKVIFLSANGKENIFFYVTWQKSFFSGPNGIRYSMGSDQSRKQHPWVNKKKQQVSSLKVSRKIHADRNVAWTLFARSIAPLAKVNINSAEKLCLSIWSHPLWKSGWLQTKKYALALTRKNSSSVRSGAME